jgi:hypothetical protein
LEPQARQWLASGAASSAAGTVTEDATQHASQARAGEVLAPMRDFFPEISFVAIGRDRPP